MSPVSSTVSSIQGHGFLIWRRVPPNPQLGSVPLLPIIICFRVLEDTLDSRHIAVVQSLNCVRLLKTPRPIACQAPLSSSISWSLLKFVSIESMMLSNDLILGRPLLLLPSLFPSIRIFPIELALYIRWPKYWSFSFSISPSNEYSGLISLGLTGLISLQPKGLSRDFSSTRPILLLISRLRILTLFRPLHLLSVACEVLTWDHFS